jgi:hypothetical protein
VTRKTHDPTPEQIAARAEAIQRTWSKRQRWKHEVTRCDPWRVPGSEQIQRLDDSVAEMLEEEGDGP